MATTYWFAVSFITPTGIPSAEAFGNFSVSQAPVAQHVTLTGIPSAEQFGTFALVYNQAVAPTGIPSAAAVGTPTVTKSTQFITPTGIPSAEAFGTPTVRKTQYITPTGIASAEAFGTPTVTTAAAPLTIQGTNASISTTVTIPSHAPGDIIVIFACRDASSLPGKPAASGTVPAWTDISTRASTAACRTAYFVATASNHTSGTWSSAQGMVAVVLRGQGASPIGGHAATSSTGAAVSTAPAVTMTNTDGTSVLLYFHFIAGIEFDSTWSSAPSGCTRQASAGSSGGPGACLNTKNDTTSDGSSAQGATQGGFQDVGGATVEICNH